jgi:hypothetical protein
MRERLIQRVEAALRSEDALFCSRASWSGLSKPAVSVSFGSDFVAKVG